MSAHPHILDISHLFHQTPQGQVASDPYVSDFVQSQRHNHVDIQKASNPTWWSTLQSNLPWASGLIEGVQFIGMTMVVFGVLFLFSNWQSYQHLATYWYEENVQPVSAVQQKQEQEVIQNILQTNSTIGVEVDIQKGEIPKVDIPVFPMDYRVIVPSIGVNIPIVKDPTNEQLLEAQDWDGLESSIQEGLESGLVHYPFTAGVGEPGNAFITGHSSDYSWKEGDYKSAFSLLTKMVVGDKAIIFKDGERFVYEAYDTFRVNPEDTWVLDQDYTKFDLTFMTCGPVGTAKFRDIVRLKQISPAPDLSLIPKDAGIEGFGGELGAYR
jgi:LPXTG-site transpeptidase (sortase) family protein